MGFGCTHLCGVVLWLLHFMEEIEMGNKKTSTKPKRKSERSFPVFEVSDEQMERMVAMTKMHDPKENLLDEEFIAKALAECLLEGDETAFKEILKAHYETFLTSCLNRNYKI